MHKIPYHYKTEHTLTITEAMTVDFEQDDEKLGKLHPVYATYWLTKHAELVSRKIILPFLEPHEEGIGFEVKIKHIASALVGMEVRLEATFLKQEKNRIYASCRAWNELGDLIATGETTQVILDKRVLETNFAELQQRWKQG